MDIVSFLFSFSGRINRRAYWGFALVYSAVTLAFCYLMMRQVTTAGLQPGMTPEEFSRAMSGMRFGWLNLVQLALLWPSIAVGVKRLHDRDYSGWFLLVLLVPLVQLWPLVVMLFLRGTEGDNRFGADPLAGQPADSWKSWAIFAGFLVVLGFQVSLLFQWMAYMESHMPQMRQPDAAQTQKPV